MIQLPAAGFRSVFSARSSQFLRAATMGDAERYAVCPLPESSSGVAGSLSLLVAFVGAMTVQFIGGGACWKPRRVFLMKPGC